MTAAVGQRILALNAFDASRPKGDLPAATQALLQRRQKAFGPTSVLFYERPLHLVSGGGVWLQEADGTRYLDVYNNVPSVGHCNPRVVRAISEQAAKLNIHTRYLYDVVHDYADRLLATFPAGLDKVAFTCTGSESNDMALRIAAIATGKRGFVVTESAYHGNTWAVTEISPSSRPGQPLAPHVRVVRAPIGDEDVAARLEADLKAAIASLEADGHGFAAFIADTIFSSDGVAADPAGFLAPAAAAARAAGGLFIADEVQPGFGRTGHRMWGFERHGVTPDVVTMGKPMANGIPLGGVVSRLDLMRGFAESAGYFNTFGGNPVASAAGLAVLAEIEERGLIGNAADVGGHILRGLQELAGRHEAIGDVRGAGLYLGVEFVEDGAPAPQVASRVINGLRDRHILIGAAGRHGNVLKIRPPLIFERQHADLLIEALDAVLTAG